MILNGIPLLPLILTQFGGGVPAAPSRHVCVRLFVRAYDPASRVILRSQLLISRPSFVHTSVTSTEIHGGEEGCVFLILFPIRCFFRVSRKTRRLRPCTTHVRVERYVIFLLLLLLLRLSLSNILLRR